ncbi:MAG: TauD/TfdA family dioxygenase [Roseiflexaceae bacterium]
MAADTPKPFGRRDSAFGRRKAVSLSQSDLVRIEPLQADNPLPLLIEPTVAGVDLIAWLDQNRELVMRELATYGGILFRNFAISQEQFKDFMIAVSGELLTDPTRTALRSDTNKVYISTEFPAERNIFHHNETWWQYTWPMKIFFYCHTAPAQGGSTTIADCRKVLARLDPSITRPFIEKGVLCVRNFGTHFGRPWQEIFQTDNREAVEAFCRSYQIEYQWLGGERMRTRHIRPVIAKHPHSGEEVWFNHVAHYHVTTNIEPHVREALLAEVGDENAPVNTYYGDGTPIDPAVVDAIREAYDRETIAFPWQEGDLMMLDNMLVAHGRSPYTGPRKILVGMTELTSWNDIGQAV